MRSLRNVHVESVHPLIPPVILMEELPVGSNAEATVAAGRDGVIEIIEGRSDRFLVVVGPCSIHDPGAALEYAAKLSETAATLKEELLVVMRVYFEKPRTTVGWKGLINDPDLDGAFRINQGLRRARKLLIELNEMGIPCATEFLDPITPQFYSELISWGAIGARTTESQTHRELASGLSAPIGFKNGTSGDVQIAVDAVRASSMPHRFVGVTEQGLAAIVRTQGNPHGHVILRGGANGPNFASEHVTETGDRLKAAGARACVMVDCSHGNSNKDYRVQPQVAAALATQITDRQPYLIGAMLESHLVAGNQSLKDPKNLVYGQSITDACLGWDETQPVLHQLAAAVRQRRQS
ncbi:MAG: hypothetical protein RJA70_705 [Pseudomonadota bacterium]|jgi:3-deoxy-7-phosphoheptulonate synthase